MVGHLALRPSRAPDVVADEHPLLRQSLVPAATLGDVPQLDVAPRRPCHVHQGRAFPERPERYADFISCGRVADPWFHGDSPYGIVHGGKRLPLRLPRPDDRASVGFPSTPGSTG